MSNKNIKFIAFIIALLVLGFFFSSELGDEKNFISRILQPATSGVSNSTGGIREFFSNLKSVNSLARENAELLQKNNELSAQITKMEEISHENEILKNELGFKAEHKDMELIPSRVINISPTSYIKTITIDKGSNDQVSVGKPVLSEGYLVGVIRQVSSNTSEVFLITNTRSLIPVVLKESRGTGILKGGLKGLTTEDIPLDTGIQPDETVLTSSVGGTLPTGIAVGKVTEVISSPSEIFQRAIVKSPVEFGKLEYVFVVK